LCFVLMLLCTATRTVYFLEQGADRARPRDLASLIEP
jgi:hypothetical protein